MKPSSSHERRKDARETAGELEMRWSIVPKGCGFFGEPEIHGEGRAMNLSPGGAALLAVTVKRLQPGVRITIACDGGTGVATVRSVKSDPDSRMSIYGLKFVRLSRVLRERLENHSPLLDGLSDYSDYIKAHHQLESGIEGTPS